MGSHQSAPPATLGEALARFRDELVAEAEQRRATRALDLPAPAARSSDLALPDDLVADLVAFADAAGDQVGTVLPPGLTDRLIAARPSPRPEPAPAAKAAASAARAQASVGRAIIFEQALRVNDTDLAAPGLEALARIAGAPLPTDLGKLASRGILRASAEACRENARREQGAYHAPLETDPGFAAPLSAPAAMPAMTATAPAGAEADEPPAPRLSEAVRDSRTHRRRAGADAKTLRDMEVACRLFIDLVGDLPLDQLRSRHVREFRFLALGVPRMHNRGAFRGLSVVEAIERADRLDREANPDSEDPALEKGAAAPRSVQAVERLTKKTVNKHLSSLKAAVLGWYRREHSKATTPFCGEFFSKKEVREAPRLIRTALTDDEISNLFASPAFTGHADAAIRSEPGPMLVRDARYWVPLIGAFSGARLEEILQLRPGDIRRVEGIDVIAIGASPEIRVKTEAGRRLVPIHEDLKRLGFLDHADDMRRRGVDLLFPELLPGGPGDRFGYAFTKWWTQYRRAVGLYEFGKDFHALRHTVATRLLNAEVNESLVAALLGHAQQGVTAGVYLSGYRIPQLKKAIDKLSYDLGALFAAAASAS